MRVKIQNFQSLGSVEIEANGLTVLVGRSNLGKSATVRAVEGALFNRAGEDFVREGTVAAKVAINYLPTNDGAFLDVTWEKGHNLNRYDVDGDLYSKVGQSAPPPVVDAGYRDLKVGGEYLRPQVAGQFDPLFLLTHPGSFISDVLSVISRLAVLLTADRACAKDLKADKGVLTIRQADLNTAAQKLEALQPIVELHQRVHALKALLDKAKEIEALLLEVRALVRARQKLVPVVALTLPAPTLVPKDLGDRWQAGRVAALRRKTLAPLAGVQMPPRTDVPSDLGDRLAAARPLAAVRRRVAPLAAMALPPELSFQELADFDQCEFHVEFVRGAVAPRRALAAVVSLTLPDVEFRVRQLDALERSTALWRDVQQQHTAREQAFEQMTNALRHVRSTKSEAELAQATLDEVLATVDICPVCLTVLTGSKDAEGCLHS